MLAPRLGFAEKPFQVNRPLPQGGGRFPSSEIFTLYFLCERDLTAVSLESGCLRPDATHPGIRRGQPRPANGVGPFLLA